MRVLRKLLPIVLLAAFLLPLIAPLLSFGQGEDAGLPACCRRNGKHHCAMRLAQTSQQAAASDSKSPQWRAPSGRCPYCPATVVSWHHQNVFTASSAQAIFANLVSHPATFAQTEARRRVSLDRSNQKRGPPAITRA